MITDPARPLAIVVEDDDAVRRSLQLLLHWRGYDVRAYATATRLLGSKALDEASVLVADDRLPDGDGLDLLRRLNDGGWYDRAVLLTAHGSPELRRRAFATGFDAVLDKPLRQYELVATLAA